MKGLFFFAYSRDSYFQSSGSDAVSLLGASNWKGSLGAFPFFFFFFESSFLSPSLMEPGITTSWVLADSVLYGEN